jgi:Na+-driven multidrug efflux pump
MKEHNIHAITLSDPQMVIFVGAMMLIGVGTAENIGFDLGAGVEVRIGHTSVVFVRSIILVFASTALFFPTRK